MDINKEEWLPIDGFEEFEVSNHGRVRFKVSGLIKDPYFNAGYMRIVLRPKTGLQYVHRLVAQAFIPNPLNKPNVDHIDGDTKNNNISNLRWVSQQENCQNHKRPKNNSSGMTGVYFHNQAKKWMARIGSGGRSYRHLGLYDTIEEACDARAKAEQEQYGEFSRNQPHTIININIGNNSTLNLTV